MSAKVAEADLLRRLQGAASSESDLRHMLRRRDIRIEELKRDQVNSDRLGRSFGGSGSSSSIPYQRLPFSLRESGSISAVSGAPAAAADCSKATTAGAAERATKEVALTADVKRLELELAEATARGEVGDEAIRAADRLGWRLFPGATEPVVSTSGGASMGDGGSVRTFCPVCGTALARAMGPSTQQVAEHGSSGRGALFLVPSADVERKAARAAAAAAENSPAAAMAPGNAPEAATNVQTAPAAEGLTASKATSNAPAAVVGDSTVSADATIRAEETHVTSPLQSPKRTRSPQSVSTRVAGRAEGRGARPASSFLVASVGFIDGVRSLEAHLTRLEAVVACGGPNGIAESDDQEEPRESGRVRSTKSSGGGQGGRQRGGDYQHLSFEVTWADALRELKAQVANLHHRAQATEEMLEVRAEGVRRCASTSL